MHSSLLLSTTETNNTNGLRYDRETTNNHDLDDVEMLLDKEQEGEDETNKIEMSDINQNWSFRQRTSDNNEVKHANYHYVLVYDNRNLDIDKSAAVNNGGSGDQEQKNHKNYSKVYLSKSEKRNYFLKNLENSGLEITISRGEKRNHLTYVLIHTPNEALFEIAEKMRHKVPLAENNLPKEDMVSRFWNKIPNPFKLPRELSTYNRFFTAPYTLGLKEKIETFCRNQNIEIFSQKDKSLLTYLCLARTCYTKLIANSHNHRRSNSSYSDKYGIERLLANQIFISAYPLHDDLDKKLTNAISCQHLNTRQKLYLYWARLACIFKYQPIHLIRDYFGEKVGFYFTWLGFYTTWLTVPAIVGVFVFIYGVATLPYDVPTNEICDASGFGNTTMCRLCNEDFCKMWKLKDSCLYSRITHVFDNGGTVFYSIVMAIWTVFLIEFWKREQSTRQFEWDTIDYESQNPVLRPDFENKTSFKKKKNPVTGQQEPYLPFFERFYKYCASTAGVLFMCTLVIVLTFSIIVYRVSVFVILYKFVDIRKYSSYIASSSAALINLAVILFFNRFYNWIAIKLTNIESHSTDASFEDSLTIKMYIFQFINYYASIFYIAFIKGRIASSKDNKFYNEPCDPSGCLVELCIQLAIIMVGKQIVNNAQEIVYPIVINLFNRNGCRIYHKREKESKPWERDFSLMCWTQNTLFDEYLEMVIQFGFIILFVVAFPLGPLFAFLNNILEIRIDAYKFLVQLRRPLARRCENIGIWLNILNTISKIGVITNGLIIAFTSEFIPRLVYQISKEKYNLSGFVRYTLSIKNITDLGYSYNETQDGVCMYRDFREPPNSTQPYARTIDYYHVLAARLAFVVCFEHFIFFTVTVLHWIIPDVPAVIRNQINSENLIIQREIWQSNNSDSNHQKTESSTSSQLTLSQKT